MQYHFYPFKGLLDVAFGKQLTKMSLVSNGVECIEISKKFYMKHATESVIQKMTEKVRFKSDIQSQNSF